MEPQALAEMPADAAEAEIPQPLADKVSIEIEAATEEDLTKLVDSIAAEAGITGNEPAEDDKRTFDEIEALEQLEAVEADGVEVAIEALRGGTMRLSSSGAAAEKYAKLEMNWRRKHGKTNMKKAIPAKLQDAFEIHSQFGTTVRHMSIPSRGGYLPWSLETFRRAMKLRAIREQVWRDSARVNELIEAKRKADSGN